MNRTKVHKTKAAKANNEEEEREEH